MCLPCGVGLNADVPTAYSGAMDIVLALLPWKIVWKAKIYKREKVGALLAMSVGVLYVLSLWNDPRSTGQADKATVRES